MSSGTINATTVLVAPGTTDPRPSLVTARGLRKEFENVVAVDGIDFDIRPGEVVGFLGSNGAGKTSIMRMIGAVSTPSGGELSILGMDPSTEGVAVRAALGVCPQTDSLDVELTARQNLTTYARYFGYGRAECRRRAASLLDFVQLDDRADDKVEELSGGMKRRISIARALINDPQIMLLDEPTTGLDPQARHLVWNKLRSLHHRGMTIVLTTHYMDEAEQLCDRVLIMDGGRIVAEGSPAELVTAHCSREVVELGFAGGLPPQDKLDWLAVLGRTDVAVERVLLHTNEGDAALAGVIASGLRPSATLVRRAGLEDVFLAVVERAVEDA